MSSSIRMASSYQGSVRALNSNPEGVLKERLVPFNVPPLGGRELEYLVARREFSGNGPFTAKCQDWLRTHLAVTEADQNGSRAERSNC